MVRSGLALPSVKTSYTDSCEYKIGTTEYEFAPTHSTARCIKPTPLIAVGIEKFSQNDFRMRFELEYRFGVGKNTPILVLLKLPVTLIEVPSKPLAKVLLP